MIPKFSALRLTSFFIWLLSTILIIRPTPGYGRLGDLARLRKPRLAINNVRSSGGDKWK